MSGADAPSLQVPDGVNIFSAQYARDGDDLVIAAKDGLSLTVTDYFAAGTPAALEAPNGAILRGDVVELLAGPRAPAQYAQADGPEGAVAIGQVETLSGSSSATRASGETVELGMGDPVFQGDVIETGADSTLGIRLEDGTLASMSAHSRLVLNEFVFEAGGSDNWMLVDLVEGAFAFLTGAIAPSGGMEITTPVAVMAIRGTMPVAFVAGEDGASQFFAASDQSYELLHAATRELLTVITSAAGFSLSSPDAPLETIELDPETLNEIDGLLEVLNQTAAEADLLGIQTDSGFHTYSGFGSIDGNLAMLIEFLLLLDGALSEEAVVEVEDSNQFLMAEAALVAEPDQAATQEMSPVTVNVLDNDSHPEGDDLTVIFADVPDGQGTVQVVEGENGQQLVYDPGTAFDYLALGETADVVITYVVADSTGATASTTVTVTLTGINQAPVAAAAADTNIDEQTDTQPLQTTVTVAFTDVDLNNVGHAATVIGVAVEGDTGKLNLDDLEGLLTPGTVTKNAGENTGSAEFDFSAASTVFDALSPEESVILTYTVEIDDQDGGTSQQTFDIVVTGTNDAPVIDVTESTVAATVVEEGSDADGDGMGQPSASGQIEASDIDNGGTTFSVAPPAGTYGVLTVSATGAWTYVLDEDAANPLALGESDTDVFIVTVTDGFGATDEVEVTITVTGANDSPLIEAETTSASATVNELQDETGSTHVHEVGGTIAFGDVDVSDTHAATVTANGSDYVGNLALGGVDQDGKTVGWTFSVVDSDIDHLAKGVKLTQTYTVTISDGQGGTVEQMVTVTMIGANDAPTIIVGDGDSASADLEEADGGLTAEGTLTVSDVSVSDVVTATVTGVVASGDHNDEIGTSTLLGYLTVDDTVIGSSDAQGTLTWTFDSLGEAFDFLAVNEELVLTYTIEVSDGTDTSSFPVTITIDGTNDAPVISVVGGDSATEGLTETDSGLTASGTLSVDDLDISDVVEADVTGVAATGDHSGQVAGALGFLSVSETVIVDDATAGKLEWTFDSGTEAFDFLAFGEQLVLTYDVVVSDGNGGTDNQSVVVTITGTNDAPLIDTGSTDATGAVTELSETTGSETAVTDQGTIAFTDLDLSDDHSAAVAEAPEGYLGTFSIGAVDQAARTVGWTFSVEDGAIDHLADGETLIQSYTVTLSDGEGGTVKQVIDVTITGSNDVPQVSAALRATAAEDSAGFAVDLLDGASDPDNGETATLRVQNVTGLSAGVSFDGGTTLNVDPGHIAFQSLAVGEKTEITVSYEIVDDQDAAVQQTATITITGTNDDPMAMHDSGTTAEDNQVVFDAADLLANDTDVDGDDLTIISVQDAENGTVSMSGDTITFTPDPNYFGPASFTYTISDGNNATSTATVDIKVTPVPDVISFGILNIDDPNLNEYDTGNLVDGDSQQRLFAIMGDGDKDLDSGETAYRLGNNLNFQGGILNNNDEDDDPVIITPSGNQNVSFTNETGFGVNNSGGSTPAELALDNEEYINFKLTQVAGSMVLGVVAFTVHALGASADVLLDFDGETATDAFVLNDLADGTVVTIDFNAEKITLSQGELPDGFEADFFGAVPQGGTDQIAIGSSDGGEGFSIKDLQITPYEATGTDPIILDLGASGFELSATAAFDLNNDGQTQTLAWTGGEDGILVMDIDGSGAIESGNEVFSPFFNGGGFADALDALASLDADGDGVIDAGDAAFADLLVWVDANSDGNSEAGELFSLADLGIASINLGAEGVDYQIDGQQILAEGQFTYSDGSTGDYVAVELDELLSSQDPLASDTEGESQLFAVTDLSIHEVIVDYRDGDVIDLTQLGFALATGDTVEDYVQYDSETGELHVDVDGSGGAAQFDLAAELTTPPPSVLVRFQDGDAIANVEIA